MNTAYILLAQWALDLIEFALLAGVLGLIFWRASKKSADPSHLFGDYFFRLAHHPSTAIFSVGLLSLFLRIALIPVVGIPQPEAHDEFSYLLAADTFAHGRFTNAPHPMSIHFQSFHIIFHPTYMSMYPPAQGVVLAAGQLAGNPWIGQLLVTAMMCATLCWMLQGWLPPIWALMGGVLAVLRLGVFGWVNGYWSTSVVTLGGALVLGALPRIVKCSRMRHALVMAVGLTILANSRPYEGLLIAIPVAIMMLVWLTRMGSVQLRTGIVRVIIPLAGTLAIAAAATCFYNYRVTGSPVRMAYQVNRARFSRAQYFLWQGPGPEVTCEHPVMQRFYDTEFEYYEENRTISGYIHHATVNASWFWRFFLGPALTLPLLAFPWLFHDRKMRFPLLALAFFFLGLAVENFFRPHYFAPAVPLLYLVILQSMRHLRFWRWRGKPLGIELARAIPLVCIAMIALRVTAVLAHAQIEPSYPRGNLQRAALVRQLDGEPGQNLILVRYSKNHLPDDEWVYNEADIDHSKIVWARDMGDARNQELLQYFHDHRIWLLQPDELPTRLTLYQSLSTSSSDR